MLTVGSAELGYPLLKMVQMALLGLLLVDYTQILPLDREQHTCR